MQETCVRSQGQKDPLEKERATPSSILALRIPWTGEPGGHKEFDTTEQLNNNNNKALNAMPGVWKGLSGW